jgi:hypothetical protein
MKVSISQPAYLPWLGYFDRINQSDIAVVLDTVMLERSSKTRFTNRNKVRTENGWSWLTIPVQTSGLGQPLIKDVLIENEQNWQGKHWGTIQQNYSKCSFFSDHAFFFRKLFETEWKLLSELLAISTNYLLDTLQIEAAMVSSSNLSVDGQKADLILSICKELGATSYISGPFGRDYLNLTDFEAAGIEVIFHDYLHPEYRQRYQGFEPYMSVIDLLFNHGPKSLEILSS